MSTQIKSNQKLLCIGDSITDVARRADAYPYGNGYVRILRELLIIREPQKQITIINKGISGNTVLDLEQRWSDDVLQMRPDWLTILIGINDAHRFLRNSNEPVTVELYAKTYDQLLQRTRAALPNCRIVLLEPFYISTEKHPTAFRYAALKLLPQYIAVVHKLSRRYRTRLVKTHAMFQKIIQHQPADFFCNEPVHPGPVGHLALAEALYAGLT